MISLMELLTLKRRLFNYDSTRIYGDVPEHMNYAEVSSIDNVYADNKGVICLNVWEV